MSTGFLFITANVGSIFQDPAGLLKSWTGEFLKTIEKLKPKFIALHFQEYGGKDCLRSHNCSEELIRILTSSQEMVDYENIRVFLDEDFKSDEKFTALGSCYFSHKNQDAHIWNFDSNSFVPVIGKEIHAGSIDTVPIKFKVKFPQEFFPECRWSRKGFMRTRWMVNGTIFDTINIHLFHDESNFVSISDFPSIYAKNRRKALEYTLNSISKNNLNDLYLFIFGDFNFRLDTREVVQKLTNCSKLIQKKNKNGELSKLSYLDDINDRVLNIEKKQFYFSDQNFFNDKKNLQWLLQYDKEPLYFEGTLFEFEKRFLPSYPFEEDVNSNSRYMNTRCPSWCDRILMNKAAKKWIEESKSRVIYEIMGIETSMGDHKPVYFYFEFHQPMPDLGHSVNGILSSANEIEAKSNLLPSVSRSTIKKYFYYNMMNQFPSNTSKSYVKVYLSQETSV